jgi:hypothetical protein
MKKPNKNCTIYWLTQWGHLTHEQSEALYLAAEVLSCHYSLSNLRLDSLGPARKKWYEKHHSSSLERNSVLHDLVKVFGHKSFQMLFDQIILGNNMPLLHTVKKHPQAMNLFQGRLHQLCDVIMAHIETSHLTS